MHEYAHITEFENPLKSTFQLLNEKDNYSFDIYTNYNLPLNVNDCIYRQIDLKLLKMYTKLPSNISFNKLVMCVNKFGKTKFEVNWLKIFFDNQNSQV